MTWMVANGIWGAEAELVWCSWNTSTHFQPCSSLQGFNFLTSGRKERFLDSKVKVRVRGFPAGRYTEWLPRLSDHGWWIDLRTYKKSSHSPKYLPRDHSAQLDTCLCQSCFELQLPLALWFIHLKGGRHILWSRHGGRLYIIWILLSLDSIYIL